MFLIKLPFKILVLPLILAITLIQWIGIFLISFSSVFFDMLAGVFFIVSILSYLMQLDSGAECLKMMVTAFCIFLVPHIAEGILFRVAALNGLLRAFLLS